MSVFWLALVSVVALVTPLLPLTAYERPVGPARLGPQWGSFDLLLGTDGYGRSTIIRLMEGARVSLGVGAGSVAIAFAIGVILGITAAYVGGRFDAIVRVILDAALAFPPLMLLLAVTAALEPSATSLIAALAMVVTPSFARLARAGTLGIRDEAFVDAARSLGASHTRIVVRELFPNVVMTLSSYVFLLVAVVMVAEGSLSFLGHGVPPPRPTWGAMINDGRIELARTPALVFIPAAVMLATIMSLNVIGDHLRRKREVPS